MTRSPSRLLRAALPRRFANLELDVADWLSRYARAVHRVEEANPKSGAALRHTPEKLLEEFSTHPNNPCLVEGPAQRWLRTIARQSVQAVHLPSIDRGSLAALFAAMAGAGVDLSLPDDAGRAPLHTACFHGQADVAMALVDCGAPLSCVDISGDSPLHDAAASGSRACSMSLLGAGADLLAANRHGLRCWETSHAKRHPELAAELLSLAEQALLSGALPPPKHASGSRARL